jgi:hypothetical protein
MMGAVLLIGLNLFYFDHRFYALMEEKPSVFSSKEKWMAYYRLVAIVTAAIVVYDTESNLSAKNGLPFINQCIAWAIFGTLLSLCC